jgi:hypothetical protein
MHVGCVAVAVSLISAPSIASAQLVPRQYNQELSVRRAQTVQGELMRDGVPEQAISIQGLRDRNLLVPTAAGCESHKIAASRLSSTDGIR